MLGLIAHDSYFDIETDGLESERGLYQNSFAGFTHQMSN
jgi:hypothetical protein